MDEAFLMRARRMLDQRDQTESLAPLDHRTLLTMATAAQAATPTAAAQLRLVGEPCPDREKSLETMLQTHRAPRGGPGSAQGLSRRLKGCFNRAVAARGLNLR